jgi:hypothetical protein
MAILFAPTDNYRTTETLRLRHALTLQGGGQAGSTLTFPNGSAGVILEERRDSTGAWEFFAESSVFRDLGGVTAEAFAPTLPPPPSPLADDEAPAETASRIMLHCRARIVNCYVKGFRHDGIHINTSHSGDANANNCVVEHCFVQVNGRHGLFGSGGNPNAGVATGVMSLSNVRWGIFDNRFSATQTSDVFSRRTAT